MKLQHRFVFILLASLLLAGMVFTGVSASPQMDDGALDTQAMDAYLREQVKSNRIPGMAFAVVKDGQVIFKAGYGDAAPGRPVTPQTQFYIGSVSKSFTALAVMKLVDRGKIELDAPVQTYIPWFQVADPDVSKQITIRNLLNHTSGLAEKGDPNSTAYTANLEEQVRLMQYVKPVNKPGTTFEYYNHNYRILGYVVEVVSGQPYGLFLKENIFLPLGMKDTVTNPIDAPNLAQGYSRFFGFPLPQTQEYIPGGVPSGYMITTAEDMARFLNAQIANRQPNGDPLVSPESLALMRTPPAGIESQYGMGWMDIDGGQTYAHGGAIHYFQAFEAINVKTKTGILALYNQDSMENMMFENSTTNTDLVGFMNGKKAVPANKSWAGWILLALAVADLANHVRLFRMLPRWQSKTAKQPRAWLWVKVALGIMFPLAVLFGLPTLMNALEGGAPNWVEPYRLMPDITIWLLTGMALNFIRSVWHAAVLFRQPRTN
jgi:CubicO group peptidase (beta-lactamase class C family)